MAFEILRGVGFWALKHPDTMGSIGLALTAQGIVFDQNVHASPPAIERAAVPNTIDQSVVDPRRELVLSVDPAEQTMWLREGYRRSPQLLQPTESNLDLVEQRVDTTLDLMGRSKSKELQKAYTTFTALDDQGRIIILPDTGRITNSQITQEAALGTKAIITQDKRLGFLISFSVNYVLNDSDSPVLAIGLAHEMQHIADFQEYLQHYSNVSAGEQTQKIEEIFANHEIYLQEEARGYAAATRAYIDLYRLLGIAIRNQELDFEAKLLVSINGDYTNPVWLSYVERTYLK